MGIKELINRFFGHLADNDNEHRSSSKPAPRDINLSSGPSLGDGDTTAAGGGLQEVRTWP